MRVSVDNFRDDPMFRKIERVVADCSPRATSWAEPRVTPPSRRRVHSGLPRTRGTRLIGRPLLKALRPPSGRRGSFIGREADQRQVLDHSAQLIVGVRSV